MKINSKQLILASTSPYRKELLEKLDLKFVALKPLIDEEKEKRPELDSLQLAQHLAFLKAQSLAGPNKVVIGGDQVVSFQGKILGKSHNQENAIKQLLSLQGQTHELITAVCLFDENKAIPFVNITKLKMRNLNQEQICRYVELDNPIDCAGSYKIEKSGIALFQSIESEDFTAIQGLPLIQLNSELQKLGLISLDKSNAN